MRRWLSGAGLAGLAIVLLMASSSTWPKHPLALPRGCRDRSCVRERVLRPSGATYALAKSWRWPNTTAGSRLLSATSSGTGWSVTRHCTINARGDAGATTWDCAQQDGGFTGTWANNTGLTTANLLEGLPNAFYADVAGGPQLTGATDVDATLNGAYTIIVTGYTKQPAATIGWWFQSLGTGAIAMLYTSGQNEMNDGTASLDNTKTCIGLWCFMSFRSGGDGGFTNRVDGTQLTGSGTHTAITSGFHTFGNRKAQDLGIEGWMESADIIQGQVPAADLEVIRQNFYNVGNTAGNTGGSAGGGIYNTSTNTVEFFNSGYASATSQLHSTSGMLCSKAHQNFTSATPLALASLANVGGTPTISNNVSSGPFANYKKMGAECDVLSCATGGCGKQGGTSDAGAGFYSAAFFGKQGLDGGSSAQITFESDGVISNPSCTFDGLTNDAGLYDCTTKISNPADGGSNITFANASFRTPDGGSFQACGTFMNYGANIESFRLDLTPVGSSNFSLTASDLPDVTHGGKVVFYHTPLYDPLTQWFTNQGTYYFFDATTASVHDITEIRGYTVAGREYDQASSDTAFETDGIGFTPFSLVATSIEWNPNGLGTCNITVKQNQGGAVGVPPTTVIVTGAAGCPVSPDAVKLCDRFDATVPSSLGFGGIDWYTQNH